MGALRILIAEDEPLSAMALQSQLEALGHEVVGRAGTGREAVELARQHTLDLAILDIRMPVMNGIDAAREIFRTTPIPIILLSGYSDPEYIAAATVGPVFQYLVKPVSLEDLGPAISVARKRFDEWRQFRGEAAALEQKLEDRKVIERAKGILMEARGLSENDAYRTLQRESQNRHQSMVEIARTILMAEDLLRDHPGT
ncbi:MAG: response regulator [Gemmatimonadetes bacterium]|nr:response regulator [Gemmatimonadota bacterium]